MAIICCTSIEW